MVGSSVGHDAELRNKMRMEENKSRCCSNKLNISIKRSQTQGTGSRQGVADGRDRYEAAGRVYLEKY